MLFVMNGREFREYKDLYNQLLSEKGRAEIGDDPKRIEAAESKINAFLDAYPKVVPPDLDPAASISAISLSELYKRLLKVIVDIINDVSNTIGARDTMSSTAFRRQIFGAFTSPDRRMYVGILFILLSFMLYFIDSAA